MALCFDTLQAYMIYITDADARINILSITPGCRNIDCLLLKIHRRMLQCSQDPLVGWGGVEYGQLILMKIIKNVVTRCHI